MKPWPRCSSCGGPAAPVGAPELELVLDVKTVSETNARGEHARMGRKKRQRKVVEEALSLPPGSIPTRGPWCVRLSRLSRSKLDDDNLAAALKVIRDGIAMALGVDDGSDAVAWIYGQGKGFGVRVEVWGSPP